MPLAGSITPNDQIISISNGRRPLATSARQWSAGGYWGGNYIFYNNTMYGFGERDTLKEWSFHPNTLQFDTNATSQTTFNVPDSISNDPTLGISVNGTTPGTAILWTTYSTSGTNRSVRGIPESCKLLIQLT